VEVKSVEKAPAIHAKNSHASPTPIVRDDAVYVHFGTLGTAKLQPGDGKTVWLCEELVYPPMHGSGGSPVLYDNKLAIICDGSTNPFVCALGCVDGQGGLEDTQERCGKNLSLLWNGCDCQG
jgi:hypothetical protein